jgi:hypothetical protein
MPLITGIHDSWAITARGMVPAVNIRWDKDLGYWWLASIDRLIAITKLYYDGEPQGDAGWSVIRGVYGGNYCTIIAINEASLPMSEDSEGVSTPDKDTIVAFDCEAMDENGLIAGDALTGAPDQLRAIINEYAYRPAPLGGWRGDHAVIHSASWDAGSELFALYKIEAARRFGGDQRPESVAEVIDSFLEAYPWSRIWWNEEGQLQFGVVNPDDVEPDEDQTLDLDKHHVGGDVPFAPGDRREVYSHLKMPFMWSAADQKFMSSYEAHDVAALPEKVVLVLDNPWSQARFDEGTVYNPGPPDDPELPDPLWDGLIAYYKMQEASGTRVESIAARNLADHNGVGVGAGIDGNAADFVAASGQWLEYSSADWLVPVTADGTEFTIGIWYYNPSGDIGARMLVAHWKPITSDGFSCSLTSSSFATFTLGGSGAVGFPSTNAWNLLVMGRSIDPVTLGPRPFLSMNGGTPNWVQSASSSPGAPNGYPLSVGALLSANNTPAGSPHYADSLMDALLIWDRGLTTAEIAELWNTGAGKFPPY